MVKLIPFLLMCVLAFPSFAEPFLIDSLRQMAANTSNDSLRTRAHIQLSFLLVNDDPKASKQHAHQAMSISRQIGNEELLMRSQFTMGNFFNAQRNYDQAVVYYDSAMTLALSRKDSVWISNIAYSKAIIFDSQGKHDQSIQQMEQALMIKEMIGDAVSMPPLLLAMGNFLKAKKDYKGARKYMLRAIAIKQANGAANMVLEYRGLGQLYRMENDLENAKQYFLKAYDNALALQSKYSIAVSLTALGMIHKDMHQFQAAEQYLQQAIAIAEELGNQATIAECQYTLGAIYNMQHEFEKALPLLQSALSLRQQAGFKRGIMTCYQLLAQTYAGLDKYEQAHEMNLAYMALKDSLINEENNLLLAEMEAKYENEKQEKEIAQMQQQKALKDAELKKQQTFLYFSIMGLVLMVVLALFIWNGYRQKMVANRLLAEQKQEIESKNKILDAQNKEKSIMLQEIHHRVKNNLQLVESLLNLQERKMSDPATKESLEVIRMRIGTMARLHERLYQSNRIAADDLMSYLKEIVHLSAESFLKDHAEIHLEMKGTGVPLSLDHAIPVGLIVNELVCNAYKHGFADQASGTITLEVQQQAEQLSIAVKDNGKGLPETIKVGSLGVRIIHALTRQLHGNFKYYNDQHGAVGQLSFSLHAPTPTAYA